MSLIMQQDHAMLLNPGAREPNYGAGSGLAGAQWLALSEKPDLKHERKIVQGRVSGIRSSRVGDIHSAGQTAELGIKADLTVEMFLFHVASMSGNVANVLGEWVIVEPPTSQHELLTYSAGLADDRHNGPWDEPRGLATTEYSLSIQEGDESGIETEATAIGSGEIAPIDPAPAVSAKPVSWPCLLHRHLKEAHSSWAFGPIQLPSVRKVEVAWSAESEQDRFASRFARRLILQDGPNPKLEIKLTLFAGESGIYRLGLTSPDPVYVDGIDIKLGLSADHYLRIQVPHALLTEKSKGEDLGAAVREITLMPVDGGAAASWTVRGKTANLPALLGAAP